MYQFLLLLFVVLCSVVPVHAQIASDETAQYQEHFYRAEVQEVLREGAEEYLGTSSLSQDLLVELLEGPDQGLELEVFYPASFDDQRLLFETGDQIIVVNTQYEGESSYRFFERYRLSSLWWVFAGFVVLVVAIAGLKGFMSLISLILTLILLTTWIVPSISSGSSPLLTAFIGSVVIATLALFLAHGFRVRTTLAWISTLITLVVAVLFAVLSVSFTDLMGLGSDGALDLLSSSFGALDMRGLLLGAIIIGTLGVLDDVTTTQVATIDELHKSNSKLGFSGLYKSGLSVGVEHIASLVNTLVIAYAGASLPIFLFITTSDHPFWVILNNEFLAEEVVRTLVGSATLIVAVPVSTLLAAWYYSQRAHH